MHHNGISLRFRGNTYSIRIHEFNGMMILRFDENEWILGVFRSLDRLIDNLEETARLIEGSLRTPRISARTQARIEEFISKFDCVWQGNES